MADAPVPPVPPGWYPDPNGSRQQRYWDGRAWTENVAPQVPPSVAAPPPKSNAVGCIIAAVVAVLLVPLIAVVLVVALRFLGSSTDDTISDVTEDLESLGVVSFGL